MRHETSKLIVSTISPVDKTDYLYETAVRSLEYSDSFIVVEKYQTKEDAESGHNKWINIMTLDPPEQLEDVGGGEIGKIRLMFGRLIYKKKTMPKLSLLEIKDQIIKIKKLAIAQEIDMEEMVINPEEIWNSNEDLKLMFEYKDRFFILILTLEKHINQKILHISVNPSCKEIEDAVNPLVFGDMPLTYVNNDNVSHYFTKYQEDWKNN